MCNIDMDRAYRWPLDNYIILIDLIFRFRVRVPSPKSWEPQNHLFTTFLTTSQLNGKFNGHISFE